MTDKEAEEYLLEYGYEETDEVKEKYVCMIKDAARQIFNHASEYVGKAPGFVDLEITIKLHTANDTVNTTINHPIISSRKINIVPEEINKEKDLSDPYYKVEKSCDNCYFNRYPDIGCPREAVCYEYSDWRLNEKEKR
jgi:hypothetical protein